MLLDNTFSGGNSAISGIQRQRISRFITGNTVTTTSDFNINRYLQTCKAYHVSDMARIFAKESMENSLNDEQKATARAFEALAENSLVATVSYFRSVENLDHLFQYLPDQEFGILTPVWKFFLRIMIPSKVSILQV